MGSQVAPATDAQGSAAPAPNPATSDLGAATGQETPPARILKPIPEQKLPGVIPDGAFLDDQDVKIETKAERSARLEAIRRENRDKTRAERAKTRAIVDGDGKEPIEGEGEGAPATPGAPEGEAGSAKAAAATPAAEAEKIRVGDQVYDLANPADRSRLAQAHRTLAGMHRSNIAVLEKYRSNEAAWERYADELETRLRSGRGGGGVEQRRVAGDDSPPPSAASARSATSTPAAGSSDSDAPFELDEGAYALIEERHGPAVARRWAMQEQEKHIEARMEKRIQEALKPIVGDREQQANFNAGLDLFRAAASQTIENDDGNTSPEYPELHNAQSGEIIGHMWAKWAEKAGDFAKTPEGVDYIIHLYRRMARAGQVPDVSASASRSAAAANPDGNAATDADPATHTPTDSGSALLRRLSAQEMASANAAIPPDQSPTLRPGTVSKEVSRQRDFLRTIRDADRAPEGQTFSR